MGTPERDIYVIKINYVYIYILRNAHMTSKSKVIFLNLKANYPYISAHIKPYSQI